MKKQIWFMDFSHYKSKIIGRIVIIDIAFPLSEYDALRLQTYKDEYCFPRVTLSFKKKENPELILAGLVDGFLENPLQKIGLFLFADEIAEKSKQFIIDYIERHPMRDTVQIFDKSDSSDNVLPYRINITYKPIITELGNDMDISFFLYNEDDKPVENIAEMLSAITPEALRKRILLKN